MVGTSSVTLWIRRERSFIKNSTGCCARSPGEYLYLPIEFSYIRLIEKCCYFVSLITKCPSPKVCRFISTYFGIQQYLLIKFLIGSQPIIEKCVHSILNSCRIFIHYTSCTLTKFCSNMKDQLPGKQTLSSKLNGINEKINITIKHSEIILKINWLVMKEG